MFDKLFSKFGGGDQGVLLSRPAADLGTAPSLRAIYQSRRNFGVNFGSLFVLEKWMFHEMYIGNATVELDAMKNCVKEKGLDKTREEMEKHWTSYCSDQDWEWLRSKGVQSVRIPIGYWMVGGGQFAEDTSFEKVAGVYKNAWSILINNYIKKAADYHISVLVDLHGLEKGANTGDHSGEVFDKPGLWDDHHAISHMVEVVTYMAHELAQYDNVYALQIVNEAPWDWDAKGEKRYYTEAINSIRKVNDAIPIIISDGWFPNQWGDWVQQNGGGNLGVIVDDHVYRCFSDDDQKKSAGELIADMEKTILGENVTQKADFIVGEYSCVLAGPSWEKTHEDKDEMIKRYGQEQVKWFRTRSAGYYFWNFKFQWGDGGEWGFRPMVDKGAIPVRNTSINIPSEDDYQRIFNQELSGHENYWNGANPNAPYEHWRFQEGFATGWADCVEFAKFDNSRIGRMVAWTAARRNEHIHARGESGFLWEWDQGFQRAIDIFAGWN